MQLPWLAVLRRLWRSQWRGAPRDGGEVSFSKTICGSQVLDIEAAFPQLHELHLAGNSLSDLRPAVVDQTSRCFRNLQAWPPKSPADIVLSPCIWEPFRRGVIDANGAHGSDEDPCFV